MTVVLEPPVAVRTAVEASAPAPAARPPTTKASTRSARRLRVLFTLWLACTAGGMALVWYGFGPYFLQREQRTLLAQERAAIERSANEAMPGARKVMSSTATSEPMKDEVNAAVRASAALPCCAIG